MSFPTQGSSGGGLATLVGATLTSGKILYGVSSAAAERTLSGSVTWSHPLTWPALAFDMQEATNFPDPEVIGSTSKRIVASFADSGAEIADLDPFTVPPEIDPDGTVTFEIVGISKTAASSKFVEFEYDHQAAAASAAYDAAYSAVNSGDKATDATQGDVERHTWTETITNLGWTAGKTVKGRIKRTAPTGANLMGDWQPWTFTILLPMKKAVTLAYA